MKVSFAFFLSLIVNDTSIALINNFIDRRDISADGRANDIGGNAAARIEPALIAQLANGVADRLFALRHRTTLKII